MHDDCKFTDTLINQLAYSSGSSSGIFAIKMDWGNVGYYKIKNSGNFIGNQYGMELQCSIETDSSGNVISWSDWPVMILQRTFLD